MTLLQRSLTLLCACALLATACVDSDAPRLVTRGGRGEPVVTTADLELSNGDCTEPDAVTLQLQWHAQAQFGGYYAAADQDFYQARCLDVTIVEGAFDIIPQQQLASGAADFALSWVPKALVSREEGLNIVNVAQMFQRSGTRQVSFADSGIESPEDLAGRRVGSWGFGNEFELFAGSRIRDLEPGTDYEIVEQNFDMTALINGEIDAAQAQIYNEYALVLETINPETGELYTPEDLTVIDWNVEGSAMLQDSIWADGSRLDDEAYQDITTRFIAASIEGWAWCRDNASGCIDIVLANGADLGRSHQEWQLNEVNALIWPSPEGAGVINGARWDQTVRVSLGEGVLQAEPADSAFTNRFVEEALLMLDEAGVNTQALGYAKSEVQVNEGGR